MNMNTTQKLEELSSLALEKEKEAWTEVIKPKVGWFELNLIEIWN